MELSLNAVSMQRYFKYSQKTTTRTKKYVYWRYVSIIALHISEQKPPNSSSFDYDYAFWHLFHVEITYEQCWTLCWKREATLFFWMSSDRSLRFRKHLFFYYQNNVHTCLFYVPFPFNCNSLLSTYFQCETYLQLHIRRKLKNWARLISWIGSKRAFLHFAHLIRCNGTVSKLQIIIVYYFMTIASLIFSHHYLSTNGLTKESVMTNET